MDKHDTKGPYHINLRDFLFLSDINYLMIKDDLALILSNYPSLLPDAHFLFKLCDRLFFNLGMASHKH